ncbi:MAG TPA: RIO1 family regulatory kinase/ATPase, partial [Spirochaetales bacterium]|nr:RIO1 family regulatory kinase/ATPase [Spirochaetales bacterium]
ILMRAQKPVIIDFPQAADPRYSTQGKAMLQRDVKNVLDYFRALPGNPDPVALAGELWQAWDNGDLYRERDAAMIARQWGLAGVL